jgi:hypothetical protein
MRAHALAALESSGRRATSRVSAPLLAGTVPADCGGDEISAGAQVEEGADVGGETPPQ